MSNFQNQISNNNNEKKINIISYIKNPKRQLFTIKTNATAII